MVGPSSLSSLASTDQSSGPEALFFSNISYTRVIQRVAISAWLSFSIILLSIPYCIDQYFIVEEYSIAYTITYSLFERHFDI